MIEARGQKPMLSADIKNNLGICIRKMEQLGFGPTLNEMIEIVQDYVLGNNITTQWRDDRPGYDWAKSFMARQKLSLKKSGLMQLARKNVTADPFVIYGLYTLL